jgi:hypothetical protein
MRRVGYVAIYFESQHVVDMSEVALLTQAVYAYRIRVINNTEVKFIPLCFVAVRKTRKYTHVNG